MKMTKPLEMKYFMNDSGYLYEAQSNDPFLLIRSIMEVGVHDEEFALITRIIFLYLCYLGL